LSSSKNSLEERGGDYSWISKQERFTDRCTNSDVNNYVTRTPQLKSIAASCMIRLSYLLFIITICLFI
jgi:hypothetical protein